jgi:glycine oxidase
MPSCVVIGGGAVGLSIAYELSARNWQVTLLERHTIGSGASWAGAGILPAANATTALHPFEMLRGWSHRLHAEWAEKLAQQTGIDNGFRRCGGLYFARTAGETAALVGWQKDLIAQQIECHALSPLELQRVEPNLFRGEQATPVRLALRVPQECQVRNPHHLQALQAGCRLQSVQIVEQAEVLSFSERGGKISNVRTPQQAWEADHYIIASGAWSAGVVKPLQAEIGILPIRGQILLYACREKLFSHVLNEGTRYLVPRDDGQVLVGATEEEVGFDTSTTEIAQKELQQFAFAVVPALQQATLVKQWSGLRPASFDGCPYLGRLPNFSNAFIAAGHFRSGLHLSPATAVVMADLLENKPSQVDLTLFRVGR